MLSPHQCARPAGGEGAADRVPQHGGEPGGPGQGGGAAPAPRRREHLGSHHAHKGHLRLQTDRGKGPTTSVGNNHRARKSPSSPTVALPLTSRRLLSALHPPPSHIHYVAALLWLLPSCCEIDECVHAISKWSLLLILFCPFVTAPLHFFYVYMIS